MKPITIIGGGLSGLSLGWHLRQEGVPVRVFESGHYPRHRVCGEFISGLGSAVLDSQGLLAPLLSAGARWAGSVSFFQESGPALRKRLPNPALCLSRHQMDRALAELFVAAGGELCCGRREVLTEDREGWVVATGRRPRPRVGGWQWLGLKAHARGVNLQSDLEMHFFSHGYVGLCRIEQDKVNVCGLFRRQRGHGNRIGNPWRQLQGPAGSTLHEKMQQAECDPESVCSVAGLDLTPRPAGLAKFCSVGDAVTMIPPVTGNGMSMAFESAAMAAETLLPYCVSARSWKQVSGEVAMRMDQRFARRLKRAAYLQRLLFHRLGRRLLFELLKRSDFLWTKAFWQTR